VASPPCVLGSVLPEGTCASGQRWSTHRRQVVKGLVSRSSVLTRPAPRQVPGAGVPRATPLSIAGTEGTAAIAAGRRISDSLLRRRAVVYRLSPVVGPTVAELICPLAGSMTGPLRPPAEGRRETGQGASHLRAGPSHRSPDARPHRLHRDLTRSNIAPPE
jgi:hypothetical protein